MERNPLIAPQVPSNDEAQVHALTQDYYSRVGNEPGSGGGKGWDPKTCPSGVQLEGGGGRGHQQTEQPPRTYNSIIHSPSSNEVQFSSVRMRTLLRRPWAQGTVQSNRTRAARGTRRRPNCAMSAARTSLRARAPLLLPTAAPLPLWRPLRSCAQGACEARRPAQPFSAHARALVSAGGGGKGGKGGTCVSPGAQD